MSGKLREQQVDRSRALEHHIETFFSHLPSMQGRRLLVAYSGGMDSSTLLTVLAESGICPLHVVHVVHNLRPAQELATERQVILARCRELSLPLTIATVRAGAIKKLSRRKKIGIEAAAREIRYGILERCALRLGIDAICTAHNADDQLETLLSRFLSSSSIDGLVGIQPIRTIGSGISLLRPLLSVSRSSIEHYAEYRNLTFSTDSSNLSLDFRRNRIRHRIIPLLNKEFPGWEKGLLGSAKKLAVDKEAVDVLLEKALAACSFEKASQKVSIPMEVFAGLPFSIRMRLLARWISNITGENRISAKALQSALLALAGGAAGVDVLGTRLKQRDDLLEILPILDFRREDGYFFVIPAEGVYRAGPVEVSLTWGRADETQGDAEDGYRKPGSGLAEGSFSFPLRLRNRKAGDAMKIAGEMRRLDDVLKSWHLDGRLRSMALVVEDGDGIVALLLSALDSAHNECEKFRDYAGPKDGRRLYIRIKGA